MCGFSLCGRRWKAFWIQICRNVHSSLEEVLPFLISDLLTHLQECGVHPWLRIVIYISFMSESYLTFVEGYVSASCLLATLAIDHSDAKLASLCPTPFHLQYLRCFELCNHRFIMLINVFSNLTNSSSSSQLSLRSLWSNYVKSSLLATLLFMYIPNGVVLDHKARTWYFRVQSNDALSRCLDTAGLTWRYLA